MSKDSSYTHVHLHASHHADLFEEFCHPPSSTTSTAASTANNLNATAPTSQASHDPSDPSLQHIPGHFLPFESIHLPPHLMPVNPEDEDGVVPDMHAAFGIARAMAGESGAQGAAAGQREDVWRDFGLDELAGGNGGGATAAGQGLSAAQGEPARAVNGVRREGRRSALLNMR